MTQLAESRHDRYRPLVDIGPACVNQFLGWVIMTGLLIGLPVFYLMIEAGMAIRYHGGRKTWIKKTRGTLNNEYRQK